MNVKSIESRDDLFANRCGQDDPGNAPLHRCWAEVDLSAIRSNAARCREIAGQDRDVIAVIKADAYGHGLERVAATLAQDVNFFGVANLTEARRVREACGGRRDIGILLLSPVAPHELDDVVKEGFSAVISARYEVDSFVVAASRHGTIARLHIMVDTGMGRIGCLPEALADLVNRIRLDRHCRLEGIATHFPSADEDRDFTSDQIRRFHSLVGGLPLPIGCHIHLANSAGLLGYQDEMSFATHARPGLALYGVNPLPESDDKLRPALSWKARVTLVRDLPEGTTLSYGRTYTLPRPMQIAALAVGYGDGYSRHLLGRGVDVLLAGQRCQVLGRVTMDQILVDVSRIDCIEPGDVAVLLGSQGEEEITATELANKAKTISWEILTQITARVPRIYYEGDEFVETAGRPLKNSAI